MNKARRGAARGCWGYNSGMVWHVHMLTRGGALARVAGTADSVGAGAVACAAALPAKVDAGFGDALLQGRAPLIRCTGWRRGDGTDSAGRVALSGACGDSFQGASTLVGRRGASHLTGPRSLLEAHWHVLPPMVAAHVRPLAALQLMMSQQVLLLVRDWFSTHCCRTSHQV